MKLALRIPIRIKLLLLMGGLLLAAMATYLALAVTLINADRRAYTYDLSQRLATTLAEQVRANIDNNAELLRFFGGLSVEAKQEVERARFADQLFAASPALLRVRLYVPTERGDSKLLGEFVRAERLTPLELSPTDLDDLDKLAPLMMAGGEPVMVSNRSLPPSAPIMTLTISPPGTAGHRPPWFVVGDLTSRELLRMFSASQVFNAFVVDANGDVVLHPDAEQVLNRVSMLGTPAVARSLAQQAAPKGAVEYDLEGHGRLGAWARAEVGRLTVVAELDRDAAYATTRRLVRLSLLFGVGILLGALLLSLVFARLLTQPIQQLSAATAELARGNYRVSFEARGNDEIGDLAHDFARMAKEIREAQAKLIQSEKMAAFGQLGAGMSHEVKNPLASIRGFAQLGKRFKDDPKQQQESLDMIERETDRCLEIIQSFLSFARQDVGKRTPLLLNDVVAKGVRLIAHQMSTGRVRLTPIYGDAPIVEVSLGQIQQVLLNLLLNAMQAVTLVARCGSPPVRSTMASPRLKSKTTVLVFRPRFVPGCSSRSLPPSHRGRAPDSA